MSGPATPPTRPALRARFDRRRDTLVDGAARVFAQRGYDQTSMQELADALGVATGAIYHYFRGKEDLLGAVCDGLAEPLLEPARSILGGDGTGEERLRALVRRWVAHVCQRRHHMLVFAQERHQIESLARWRHVRDSRREFDRLLRCALQDAGVDAGFARLALLGMVNHLPQWYRPRGRLTPEQIADGYVDLLLKGIRSRSATARRPS